MTLYERYEKLNIDFGSLGLARGETESDYFCTPIGAKVIGWAGVDGIHCCFVPDFGETVFAVSPMNYGSDHYVYPVARDFCDFLRLVLACRGLAAIEQASAWDEAQFDAFLIGNPPSEEGATALSVLRDTLGLSPMEEPFRYVKDFQASFPYERIPMKPEYYEAVGERAVEDLYDNIDVTDKTDLT